MDNLLYREDIKLIRNFEEAKTRFYDKRVFHQEKGTENFRRDLILIFDYPIKRQRLASLPDLLVPPGTTVENILSNMSLLEELLSRNHDINETSSRGSLLHLMKRLTIIPDSLACLCQRYPAAVGHYYSTKIDHAVKSLSSPSISAQITTV